MRGKRPDGSLANERHNVIAMPPPTVVLKNAVGMEGQSLRRFSELPLVRNRAPALRIELDAVPCHR